MKANPRWTRAAVRAREARVDWRGWKVVNERGELAKGGMTLAEANAYIREWQRMLQMPLYAKRDPGWVEPGPKVA